MVTYLQSLQCLIGFGKRSIYPVDSSTVIEPLQIFLLEVPIPEEYAGNMLLPLRFITN